MAKKNTFYKLAFVIINSRTKKVLLEKGRLKSGFVEWKEEVPESMTYEQFGSICIKKLEKNFDIRLKWIGLVDIDQTKKDQTILFFLMTTRENGKPATFAKQNTDWYDVSAGGDLFEPGMKRVVDRSIDILVKEDMADFISTRITQRGHPSVLLLESNIVRDGSLCGWPHYLSQPSIGGIGTAIGLLCFSYSSTQNPFIADNISTLRSIQNEDGGWSIRSTRIGTSISITESTLFVLWALNCADLNEEDPSILKALEWLRKNQKKSGGWCSSINAKRERTFTTAFAVRILSKFGISSGTVKNGIEWLKRAQNPDGGWGTFSRGSKEGSTSSITHTAHALIALVSAGISLEDDVVKNGSNWLATELQKTRFHERETQVESEFVDGEAILEYKHFSTPWAVIALLATGIPLGNDFMLAACKDVLERQNLDGSWTHPLAPGFMPIWAMHDGLMLLNKLTEITTKNVSSITRVNYLDDEVNLLARCYWEDLMDRKKRAPKYLFSFRWLLIWNILTSCLLVWFILDPTALTQFSAWLKPILITFLGTGIVGGLAPFLYQVLFEEYKKRRSPVETPKE